MDEPERELTPEEQDAYDRLPEEVKEAKRQYRLKRTAEDAAAGRRRAERHLGGTAVGGVAAGVFAPLLGLQSLLLVLPFAVVGGVAAWVVVHWRLSHLGGMCLYGGVNIGLYLLLLALGGVKPPDVGAFSAWLVFTGIGAALAWWAQSSRGRTDSPF